MRKLFAFVLAAVAVVALGATAQAAPLYHRPNHTVVNVDLAGVNTHIVVIHLTSGTVIRAFGPSGTNTKSDTLLLMDKLFNAQASGTTVELVNTRSHIFQVSGHAVEFVAYHRILVHASA